MNLTEEELRAKEFAEIAEAFRRITASINEVNDGFKSLNKTLAKTEFTVVADGVAVKEVDTLDNL